MQSLKWVAKSTFSSYRQFCQNLRVILKRLHVKEQLVSASKLISSPQDNDYTFFGVHACKKNYACKSVKVNEEGVPPPNKVVGTYFSL